MNIFTKDKIKSKIYRIIGPFKRIGLTNKNFSILSNNCWGGIIYRNYALPYLTPTCGLYFFSNDYLKFLKNLDKYLSLNLVQISKEKSAHSEKFLNSEHIIIGKLGDIELIFVHYKNFEDAKNKWDRRKKRLNKNNLIVKFSDQNSFKKEDFLEFEKLNYKNKIFITVNKSITSKKVKIIYLDDINNIGYAKDDIKPSFKKFNLKKYLNSIKPISK